MPSLRSIYPKAYSQRLPSDDLTLRTARKSFFKAVGNNFIILQLLFLALFCYIFGSLYQQTNHTHNLNIAFVDYDGGAISQAVRSAYATVQGPNFPTLVEQSPAEVSPEELRKAVCKTDYWAALYISPNSSQRLSSALASDASPYNLDNTLAYIWNEARYAPIADSSITSNLIYLSDLARISYLRNLSTINIPKLELTVLAQPWTLQSLNIQPTTQGSRAIYNTIVIVLVLIQEFFYLGTINGLYVQFKLYSRVGPYRISLVRNLNSLVYTLIGSLCVTGTIWAFKSGWGVNSNQFVLTWMALWLFAHCNFLTLDVFTIWLPGGYVPMALISWVILNITSVLLPFELSPAFFQLGYVFPAHEVYQVLTTIWSRGCGNQLSYALPVLFAWEVVGLVLGVLGVFRRCHFAVVAEERQAREFKERVDAAVAVHLAKMKEIREREVEEQEKRETGAEGVGEVTDGEESGESLRDELADVMERINTRQTREHEKDGVPCNFGPAFDLPFRRETSHDSA